MAKRIWVLGLGLALLLSGGFLSRAEDAQVKDPQSKYGLIVKVRKSTEDEFGKDPRRYGVELYEDLNNHNGLYLSETGSIAAIGGKSFKAGDGKGRDPLFRYGLNLLARPAGEKEWDKGKKFSLELYKDETSGDLLYVSENGDLDALAGATANDVVVQGKPKNPTWKHSWDLKVRKAGDKDFNKDTKKIGVEVYRDPNNGNWIYLSETGSFAAVPGKLVTRDDAGKDVVWQYGLELAARKAGEKEFTKDTKKFGVEAFLDGNNGNLIYITETGNLAVAPGKRVKPTEGAPKGPELKHAMDLQVRKAAEREFSKESKKYGVEAYGDENNGFGIYITETGDISVVSDK